MLNPPLSLLSDDLIGYLVEHVARLTFANGALHNLSLADPAFTEVCQTCIFRTLTLGERWGTRSGIYTKLEKMKSILEEKPLFANRVRRVKLYIAGRLNAWLLQNPSTHPHCEVAITFILQLLAKSPVPPHELEIEGFFQFKVPKLVVGWLSQSFFSQTLTILHLTKCRNVPLPLFLVCPRLKEVHLDLVGVAEGSYNEYPDEQCSGRVSPALERFNYRSSHTVVKQMVTPPPRFHTPVVLWSKLRVLTLSPHEREEMTLLQPILDEACNTLEELYLTNLYVGLDVHLPLIGLVNLSGLPRLRVFALYVKINCNTPGSTVLRDINIVLGTIPVSNTVTNLSIDFKIFGEHPFRGCLDEDWVGICDEVIRISSGKPLELDLKTVVSNELGQREDELYAHIMEKTTSLSGHPQICAHFWNPTYWNHGLGPFPRGQVRSRCRR